MKPKTQLIVALDVDTLDQAAGLVDAAGPAVEWYKVGKQLFTRCGPAAVSMLNSRGKKVFLDLKYHDIPNTVAGAVTAAAGLGAKLLTVHACGGPAMLKAAAAAGRAGGVLVLAVTVLTSMDAAELRTVGVNDEPAAQVRRLGALAKEAGVPGAVCSPLEIEILRQACGEDFTLVIPGIRPAGADLGDQKRVMTPARAAAAGANFIVVGRPITAAPDPAAAALAILAECQA